MCSLLICLLHMALVQDDFQPHSMGVQVIPMELESNRFSGEDWVEVHYLAQPDGKELYFEAGERIWRVQDRVFILFGASGLPLPNEITQRAEVFVRLSTSQGSTGPFSVYPRQQAITLGSQTEIHQALKMVLPGVDASYLVQVAHFLSGNLATLDVLGTSFSVAGFGTVISAEGDWVGGQMSLSDANGNIFVGENAGASVNGGNDNVGLGRGTLEMNATGSENIAIGLFALHENMGSDNLAIGKYSLFDNTWGSNNTAVGRLTLHENVDGYSNSAFGHNALKSNGSGSQNTAIGTNALFGNQTGSDNTAVGAYSGYGPTTGSRNTSIGAFSFQNTTSGEKNTALGYGAMRNNTSGNKNTAGGNYSLYVNTTGDNNTALGEYALHRSLTGHNNAAVGAYSLQYLSSGSSNTALGYYAGTVNGAGSLYNTTALGSNASVSAANQVRIGNAFTTSIGGYAGWSNLSDGRFKQDVTENVPGLDFILALRPVTYRLDLSGLQQFLGMDDEAFGAFSSKSNEQVRTGFIAQEVELAAKKLGFSFSGIDQPGNDQTPYSLRYAEFVVPLAQGMQEQQAEIDRLQQQIRQLQMEVANLISNAKK